VTSAGLRCDDGHVHPVVDGIPVMLHAGIEQTHPEGRRSLEQPANGGVADAAPAEGEIHPFVDSQVGATCGWMYVPLIGRLDRYPIPRLREPDGAGRTFLEIGCNWGRWCVAAERQGYRAVGIDPSLRALLAARHVARELGVEPRFVVADGRYLPFRDDTFDVVFSYSVLQHLAKEHARLALGETARVLVDDGRAIIQLPNRLGLRALFHQLRHGFREPQGFEVRYWSVGEIRRTFEALIGPTEVSVDGIFTLNAQAADIPLLPARFRALVRTSEAVRRLSQRVPALVHVADSLFAHARPARPKARVTATAARS